jgi:uncharacterized tellurite resistance protein B-like protein
VKTIRSWLGLDARAERRSAGADALDEVVARLEQLEPVRARYLAGFAYLLGRVARADLDVSDDERRAMERLVVEHGQIAPDLAAVVVALAQRSNDLFGGTANLPVAREFAEVAAYPERLALLRCLFAVSAADEGITTVEDNEIRQVSRELHVEHADFIAIRGEYRTHLTVLRRERPPTDER